MNTTEAVSLPDRPFGSHDEFCAAYGAWITTLDGFQQLRGEWTELFRHVAPEAVSLSFESVCERLRKSADAQLAIIAVRNAGGRMVGLAPFHILRSLGGGVLVRRLSFLAEVHSTQDHLKILVDPEFEDAVIQEIARMLVHHSHEWDSIDLSLPGLMPLIDYVNTLAATPVTPLAGC